MPISTPVWFPSGRVHRRVCAGMLGVGLGVGLLLLGSDVWAVEFPLPASPQDVHTERIGDQEVVWVDWGAVGGARVRDPDLIQDQGEALRAFLRSGEMKARCLELIRRGQDKELDLVRRRLVQWQAEYQTREQTTALPRSERVRTQIAPLPPWAWGMPMDLRRSTQVLIFDDRDVLQQRWVLAHAHDDQRLSFAYCTGWRSGALRDRFWSEHPVLSVHPVATEDFAVAYGVTAYPALIRFDADTITVTEGLDP